MTKSLWRIGTVSRVSVIALAVAAAMVPLLSSAADKPAGAAADKPADVAADKFADVAAPLALPEELQAKLDAVMRSKISEIVGAKDADGQPYKRATSSRRFRKLEDGSYQTSLLQDTATKDSLTTERFMVTLKSDSGGGKWTIASQEIKDTYVGLLRSVAGDEEFAKFSAVDLSREGLSIKGGAGSLYKDFRFGTMSGIVFTASGLQYDFAPQDKLIQSLFKKLRKDYPGDVAFTPQYVLVQCDGASCDDILKAFTGLTPATLETVDAKLRDKYDDHQRELKKYRRDEPFGGFLQRPDPARRSYSIQVAKDGPQRFVALEYDTWETKEVTFGVYNLDKSFAYYAPVYKFYSEASLKSGTAIYDLEKRDDPDARDYDLSGLSGTVELGISDAEDLQADMVFTIKTKRKLREIPFFISRLRQTEEEKQESKDPQLIVNSVEDGAGQELTWVKGGASSGLVILPEEVPAGTTVKVHMVFKNKAAIHNFTSTFSYVDRFGWLPFVRFTDMIHDFRFITKVPARKHILGIGKKVSEKVEDNVRITEWVADSPVEFPSVTFGEYDEVSSKVEAKKIDGTKIPVMIHVDKTGIPIFEGIRIRDIISMSPKALQFLADQAANSLNLYREIYGVDYPYGKLDLVNDPLGTFYGQSPSSLVYLGEATFASQGTAGDMGGGDLSKFNRQVVPHEVGHQWWGSLIPNSNNNNYWFVESLAEYSSALYVEYEEGKDDRAAYQEKTADWRREILEVDLLASVQDASLVWGGKTGGEYRAAVYAKGPYAFHIMRSTWGDEKFFKFLKLLAGELKNKAIVTRDIQKIAEQAFGGNMDFFFDQWLRGVGTPEYTFQYSVRATEDGKYVVEGKVDQRVLIGQTKELLDGVYYTAIVPITIVGSKSGKESRVPIKVLGASTPFRFKVDEKPKETTLNKYGESLAFDVIVRQQG